MDCLNFEGSRNAIESSIFSSLSTINARISAFAAFHSEGRVIIVRVRNEGGGGGGGGGIAGGGGGDWGPVFFNI